MPKVSLQWLAPQRLVGETSDRLVHRIAVGLRQTVKILLRLPRKKDPSQWSSLSSRANLVPAPNPTGLDIALGSRDRGHRLLIRHDLERLLPALELVRRQHHGFGPTLLRDHHVL